MAVDFTRIETERLLLSTKAKAGDFMAQQQLKALDAEVAKLRSPENVLLEQIAAAEAEKKVMLAVSLKQQLAQLRQQQREDALDLPIPASVKELEKAIVQAETDLADLDKRRPKNEIAERQQLTLRAISLKREHAKQMQAYRERRRALANKQAGI